MNSARILVIAAVLAFSAQAMGQAASVGAAGPAGTAGATSPAEGPSEVVQTAAQNVLKGLDADRAGYRKDPAKIGTLVDKYLLPHFDTEFAARLVLGQHWRNATPDQRKRFIDAFYHSLLDNYGAALVDFTADRLKVYPTSLEPGARKATVRTEIKRDNGDRVAVNYYMHLTDGGWKAWDVVIDGISYVNSYRQDFGPQIDQQGLDAVISRLEKGEKPGEIGKTRGKVS